MKCFFFFFEYSVYINSSMFQKHSTTSLKVASNTAEESTFHPLPNLLRLLGLTPFKKVMVCSFLYLLRFAECLIDCSLLLYFVKTTNYEMAKNYLYSNGSFFLSSSSI